MSSGLNLNPAQFGFALLLLPLIDLPWLLLQQTIGAPMFSAIQGRKVTMKLWPAVVVYLALAYLLLQQTSITGAALSGAATYAVYDFTNLAVFDGYKLTFALADSLWGGVLFAAAFAILKLVF